MPLPAGTRLGPYAIVAPLGAGGMGEVYRARDTRLQRDVAIKVLPRATADDPDAMARFDREARMVAALAHPNLLALYDVGSDGGVAYAVTELLVGSTLRERLASGALPVVEALAIARQMAQGLAAAHAKGIVHRDLKPANVFVTDDGHVKILDFGLAKLTLRPAEGDAAHAETVISSTTPGTVMGTMGYMAPEQLLGQPVDPRADVFGFGVVLYEILAGRRAFEGANWTATVAATLTQEPPAMSSFGRLVPPAVEAVVRRCLEKAPGARFASAREVLDALGSAATAEIARQPVRARRRAWPWVIAGCSLVGLALGLRPARELFLARPRVAMRPQAVAMLEFENLTNDRALDWIGHGLPELLGTALARSDQLDVYDPQRLANLLTGFGGAGDASASLFERLRTHGVGRAIVGSLLKSGRGVRVQCRVVDVESGRVLHADASDGAASDDLFQLAGSLIPKLQTWLEIDLAGAAAGDQWLRNITTSSADAYRLYLRGHEAMMASRWRESVAFAEQSLALDSTFVAASVDLIGCYWNLGEDARMREALAAAKRRRDRASPREALQIDVIDAVVSQDAERLIRSAASLRELFPENRFFTYLLGRGYFTAERWNRCLEVLEPLARQRWTWAWTYILMARAHEKLGRTDAARRSLELGMDVTDSNPELAFEYARFLGAQGDARRAREVLAAASRSPELGETPEYETEIRLELGRIYEADALLDSARTQYQRILAIWPAGTPHARKAGEGLQRVGPGR